MAESEDYFTDCYDGDVSVFLPKQNLLRLQARDEHAKQVLQTRLQQYHNRTCGAHWDTACNYGDGHRCVLDAHDITVRHSCVCGVSFYDRAHPTARYVRDLKELYARELSWAERWYMIEARKRFWQMEMRAIDG